MSNLTLGLLLCLPMLIVMILAIIDGIRDMSEEDFYSNILLILCLLLLGSTVLGMVLILRGLLL